MVTAEEKQAVMDSPRPLPAWSERKEPAINAEDSLQPLPPAEDQWRHITTTCDRLARSSAFADDQAARLSFHVGLLSGEILRLCQKLEDARRELGAAGMDQEEQ